MSNRRSNAPPAPSWNTGAVETEWTPRQIFEMPLPGENIADHLRRLTRHSREVETLGVRARQGDFRFTHTNRHYTRGPNKRKRSALLAGDGKGRGRPVNRAESTSAADSRAATEERA